MSRAMVVCAPAAVFFGYAFFLRTSPSVMAPELMRDFDVGGALLGNLSAFYFYSYAGIQIAVGVLVDSYGPRRVLSAAGIAAGFGTLLFALSTTLEEAYAGRLILGAGAGFGWVATVALIARWFPPRRFALAAGIATGVGMIGAAMGQAPLAAVVEAFGWRGPMLGAGVFGAILAASCWLLIRDHPVAAAESAAPRRRKLLHSLSLACRNPQTWLIALFTGALIAPFLSVTSLWGVPYMMHVRDFERAHAALVASSAIAGMAVGAPFLGWLSDRIGRRKPVMYLAIAAQALAVTAAFYWPSAPELALPAAFFVFGFFASCIVVGFAAGREANSSEATGAASSIINTAVISGGAIIQPVIGMMLDVGWAGGTDHGVRVYDRAAYAGAFHSLYVSLALSLMGALLIRETFCGTKRDGRS